MPGPACQSIPAWPFATWWPVWAPCCPAGRPPSQRMEKRLVRAGYRHPHALRVLYGARLICAIVLPLVAVVVVWRLHLATDMKMLAVGAAALAGYVAPGSLVTLKARRRQRRIRRGLPDALDLLVICVESGLGLDQAIMQVAKELEIAHPDISLEFALVNLELRAGKRRAEALRNLADRTAVDELRKLVAVLIQADRFGTGIAQSLRTHSDYMRVQARQSRGREGGQSGRQAGLPDFLLYPAHAVRGHGRSHGDTHYAGNAAHDEQPMSWTCRRRQKGGTRWTLR